MRRPSASPSPSAAWRARAVLATGDEAREATRQRARAQPAVVAASRLAPRCRRRRPARVLEAQQRPLDEVVARRRAGGREGRRGDEQRRELEVAEPLRSRPARRARSSATRATGRSRRRRARARRAPGWRARAAASRRGRRRRPRAAAGRTRTAPNSTCSARNEPLARSRPGTCAAGPAPHARTTSMSAGERPRDPRAAHDDAHRRDALLVALERHARRPPAPCPSANHRKVAGSVLGNVTWSSATWTTRAREQRRRAPSAASTDSSIRTRPLPRAAGVQPRHRDRVERQHEVEAHLDAEAPGGPMPPRMYWSL